MKKSRSEGVYLFLTILVIAASAYIYIVFAKKQSTTSTYPTSYSTTINKTNESSKINAIKVSLAAIEKSLSKDEIQPIQEAIDNLTQNSNKVNLQSQLDKISTEISNFESAEQAVSQAESLQTQTSVTTAQTAIDALTNEEKKSSLQARLDIVKENLKSNLITPIYDQTPTVNYYNTDEYDTYDEQ